MPTDRRADDTTAPGPDCDCRRIERLAEAIYERAVTLSEDGEVDFSTFGEPAATILRILRDREVAA